MFGPAAKAVNRLRACQRVRFAWVYLGGIDACGLAEGAPCGKPRAAKGATGGIAFCATRATLRHFYCKFRAEHPYARCVRPILSPSARKARLEVVTLKDTGLFCPKLLAEIFGVSISIVWYTCWTHRKPDARELRHRGCPVIGHYF